MVGFLLKWKLCLVIALSGLVLSDAQTPISIANTGGQFRYATMFWQRVDDPSSNTVQLTLESAWRRSFSTFTAAQNPSGDTIMKINGRQSPMIDFGDGSIQFLENVRITAYSSAEDWFMGVQVFTHAYATPTNQGQPWTVTFKGCCRLSTLQHNSDTPWALTTYINLLQSDRSPRAVTLPVIYLRSGQLGNFSLQTAASLQPANSSVVWSAPALPPSVTMSPTGRGQAMLACPQTQSFCLYNLVAYAAPDAASAAAGGGAQAPVELILNVTQPAPTDPLFAAPLAAAQADPVWNVALYPGFMNTLDISGYLSSPAAAGLGVYVGFTVGPLPDGARLSAVRGKGVSAALPATMTLRWMPAAGQLGAYPVCLDAVNSLGTAATQRCIGLAVLPDPPPAVSFALDGHPLAAAPRPPQQCRVSPCYHVTLYMGRQHVVTIQATDANSADILSLSPVPSRNNPCNASCPLLPPGSTLSPLAAASPAPAAGVAVQRQLVYAPAYDDGGYVMEHCFQAQDSCGSGDGCPGGLHTDVQCVWVQVVRCQFIVRQGQQLQEIAAVYNTDWLQLWSLNPDIMHPDLDLVDGNTLYVGHDYMVQPFEVATDVAKRFGMDAASMTALNADLRWTPSGLTSPICDSVTSCSNLYWCIIPNSCKGASGSIYAAPATGAATGTA